MNAAQPFMLIVQQSGRMKRAIQGFAFMFASAVATVTGSVAAELFVHPQTVRYRMGQLRDLYGERLDDLPMTLRDEISHFFSIYKTPEWKVVKVDGWYPREEALESIERAKRRFREQRS